MIGACPYLCSNKTDFGYCRTTGCINPKYSQTKTVTVMDKKTCDAIRMAQDPDYGRGDNA